MPRKNALQIMTSKGGRARAAKLGPERLSEIAREAANTRWADRKRKPVTCKCCGVTPDKPQRDDRPYWCADCRAHRTGKGTDRTYQAAHGEPCPYRNVPLEQRKAAR